MVLGPILRFHLKIRYESFISVPYWYTTLVSRYFAFLDRIVTLQGSGSLLYFFVKSSNLPNILLHPQNQDKSQPEVPWVELFKYPWYEIWSPIRDQEIPSQNIPDEKSDDMTFLVLSQNIPSEISDDMKFFSHQDKLSEKEGWCYSGSNPWFSQFAQYGLNYGIWRVHIHKSDALTDILHPIWSVFNWTANIWQDEEMKNTRNNEVYCVQSITL